jgi:hypothetical protein
LHSGRGRPRSTDGNVSGARVLRRVRRGRVSWPRDVNDVFRKRLRRGARYRVTLDARRRRNLDLVAYRPGTKEIWQFEAGCYFGGRCKVIAFRDGRSGDAVVRFRARRSRVHFFQVSAFFTTGRYRLRITRL